MHFSPHPSTPPRIFDSLFKSIEAKISPKKKKKKQRSREEERRPCQSQVSPGDAVHPKGSTQVLQMLIALSLQPLPSQPWPSTGPGRDTYPPRPRGPRRVKEGPPVPGSGHCCIPSKRSPGARLPRGVTEAKDPGKGNPRTVVLKLCLTCSLELKANSQ